MGIDVWSLDTVQFSNHTQYPQWTGSEHLTDIVNGISKIQQLKQRNAVLTGYIGSAEQGKAIIEIFRQIKTINPAVWYFYDPVMGHACRKRLHCRSWCG